LKAIKENAMIKHKFVLFKKGGDHSIMMNEKSLEEERLDMRITRSVKMKLHTKFIK
jgi:hypothetical protein